MLVYEKRPTGLAPNDLKAFANAFPAPAWFAAARTIAGLVCFAFVTTSLGIVLFFVGLALLASTVPTVRQAADFALQRPALLLTNQPRWDGVRRKVWTLDAGDGDVVALGRSLAEALDAELGESRTAFDEDGEFRGDTRNAVFQRDAHAPGQVAWSIHDEVSVTPAVGADGVWLRIERLDPFDADSMTVTVVSNDGGATRALKVAAGRSSARS